MRATAAAAALSLAAGCAHRGVQAPLAEGEALVAFYADCETVTLDSGDQFKQTPAARPRADVIFRWSSAARMRLTHSVDRQETGRGSARDWRPLGSDLIDERGVHPLSLIADRTIGFDGERVTDPGPQRSYVREKQAIGIVKRVRLGGLRLDGCQDYLLKTDFGKRRTIECEEVGLVAEDHYRRTQSVFYPVRRLVAVKRVRWEHPRFSDFSRAPPYHAELVRRLGELDDGIDFLTACGWDFLDILFERGTALRTGS